MEFESLALDICKPSEGIGSKQPTSNMARVKTAHLTKTALNNLPKRSTFKTLSIRQSNLMLKYVYAISVHDVIRIV